MFPDPLQAEVSTSLTWSRNNGNRGDHIPGDASGAELRYVRSGLLCHETSTDTVSWLQFGVQSRDMTREAAYCDEQLMRELFALRSSWMSSVLGWRGIVATHQELVDLILKPCTSRPANSEHYVVCQDRLNKCPDMGEYLLSVNMVMWENSRQIDGLKALIDALSPATRLNRLTTTLSRKKLWRFWKLAHKSAVAPTADAKTKQAPENAAHFVNVKTLELFLSSGNIFGFTTLDRSKMPVVPSFVLIESHGGVGIDPNLDDIFQIVLKKMLKKDTTTRTKALQKFTELISK
ncbi:hypothetical protein quinque_013877 [Culex quinquefasciatus]